MELDFFGAIFKFDFEDVADDAVLRSDGQDFTFQYVVERLTPLRGSITNHHAIGHSQDPRLAAHADQAAHGIVEYVEGEHCGIDRHRNTNVGPAGNESVGRIRCQHPDLHAQAPQHKDNMDCDGAVGILLFELLLIAWARVN